MMIISYKNKYNIIIVGSGFFASYLAVQLAETGLNILLFSQKDFGDYDDNVLVQLTNFSKKTDDNLFYSTFSHSLIPVSLYKIQNNNIIGNLSNKVQSIVNKNIIDGKSFNKIEKTLNVNKNIKIENNYKINYSRLCIDTAKTAKNKAVDIANNIIIEELKSNEIKLISGERIKTDLIINADFSLVEESFQKNISVSTQKLIRIPKHSLNINNPIRLTSKNLIELIPYFSEVFIHAKEKIDVFEEIGQNLGVKINKNVIIDEKIINNYNSDIFISQKNILNVFENDYSKFKEKTIEVLKQVSDIFSINTPIYNEFKIFGTYTHAVDKYMLMQLVEEKYLQIQETGISSNDFTVLFYRYGSDIEKISEKAYDFYNNKETRKHAWLYAELWYSVNYEFVKTPVDFINRRTNLFLFNQLDNDKQKIITNFIEKNQYAK